MSSCLRVVPLSCINGHCQCLLALSDPCALALFLVLPALVPALVLPPHCTMVNIIAAAVGLQRLRKEAVVKLRTRSPWRLRRKKQHLTSIQKTQRKLLRLERKETLDTALGQARAKIWEMAEALHATNPRHSAQYYFRLIMQHTRLKSQQRLPSRWNAFLSLEMEQRNKGELY